MATIFFVFNNFILFFKLILLIFVKLFFIPNPFSRYILLVICLIIIYLLWKYPRSRFRKLSQLRNYTLNKLLKYRLNNTFEHIYNIIFIVSFSILFIIVIFSLRYFNSDKNIDLIDKYHLIKDLYNITSLYDCLFNCIIFLLIFIIYIWLFIKVIKYFKFHVIKRHLYLVGGLKSTDNTWYQSTFFLVDKKNIYNIHFDIIRKIQEYYEKYYFNKFNKEQPENFYDLSKQEKDSFYVKKPIHSFLFFTLYKEDRILFHLMTKWHYVLVIILFLYDLIYNNYQITHVFYVLPWTFFFEIYLRFSTFVEGLWIPHDEFLHTVLYSNFIEIWDNNTLLIDGNFYDYKWAKIIYKTYVARDFVKDSAYL